ncbi:hypothetical protein SAMN02745131_03570 [Flavisolibacter ginsengisoli DSM 18119]|jgi:hypothetical protein|uniref:Uncharacterized protein n=1 Tax=Flavisolibacter ginsengisoli DSM 18119 TaxID=1121884 RepID=A0A1M5ENQ1_9BACT|nr:hypothetical protein SAMN02745131_03570 [Flavisolibacter ginsengisoli DSM 18119]
MAKNNQGNSSVNSGKSNDSKPVALQKLISVVLKMEELHQKHRHDHKNLLKANS